LHTSEICSFIFARLLLDFIILIYFVNTSWIF